MTCLNSDGSPCRCGTVTGLASGRGFSRPVRLYVRRLLALTSAVYLASCAASGTSMIDTEPSQSCVFLPSAAGRGSLRAPTPLTLATNSFLPSADTTTAPGYQAVGISPATVLCSGRSAAVSSDTFLPSRTTTRQLLVPLATQSVAPSGDRARA